MCGPLRPIEDDAEPGEVESGKCRIPPGSPPVAGGEGGEGRGFSYLLGSHMTNLAGSHNLRSWPGIRLLPNPFKFACALMNVDSKGPNLTFLICRLGKALVFSSWRCLVLGKGSTWCELLAANSSTGEWTCIVNWLHDMGWLWDFDGFTAVHIHNWSVICPPHHECT